MYASFSSRTYRHRVRGRPGSRAPLAQPAAQDVSRRLQVDDQIGRRQIGHEQLVETLIDEQLVVVQVQIRVDLVPLEQVIADRELAEEIALAERGLLAVTPEREEQLRLKRRTGPPRLEVGEKRIVGFVEDDRRIESRAEPIGEQRLA